MDLTSLLPKGLMDPYDRPARLYPGLLVLAPIAALLVCIYTRSHPWVSGTLSVLVFCGGAFAIGRISRDAGKRLQDRLFKKVGRGSYDAGLAPPEYRIRLAHQGTLPQGDFQGIGSIVTFHRAGERRSSCCGRGVSSCHHVANRSDAGREEVSARLQGKCCIRVSPECAWRASLRCTGFYPVHRVDSISCKGTVRVGTVRRTR